MLNKLYKYTALRLEFFDNLMIRASQKYALNDPFELMPTQSHKNKNFSDDSYFDYAVASLSETNNNLLMWSHYADQHQGIVIEFYPNKPLFDSYKSFAKTKYDSNVEGEVIDEEETEKRKIINAGVVQRVRYSSMRPKLNKYETLLEHFLVKSEEWIYEKEHRVILPLVAADKVIVHEKHLAEIEELSYSEEVLEKTYLGKNMFMVNFKGPLLDEYRALYSYNSDYLPDEIMEGAFVESIIYSYLQKISKDSSTVFLYKVPPDAIKAIYIGCRVAESERQMVLDKIKSKKDLSHISVFQAETSSNRFELKFKKVAKNLIGTKKSFNNKRG
ncbi:DUF2971 domain-containing protein [Rheinheimera sp. YQF-2]|uniref:DUF2971 domain-containing protein n=1 Tax=Rheinheimera lutimaris TaxID=2740584 RepID=A0A7Y5EIP1_9GAMM|nr:DUF2971 domain-containing protein [Rheinheimera lutimaris]NRQ42541.1 DUF2971 domain-containing protein [Rheinheimera lutimaris]